MTTPDQCETLKKRAEKAVSFFDAPLDDVNDITCLQFQIDMENEGRDKDPTFKHVRSLVEYCKAAWQASREQPKEKLHPEGCICVTCEYSVTHTEQPAGDRREAVDVKLYAAKTDIEAYCLGSDKDGLSKAIGKIDAVRSALTTPAAQSVPQEVVEALELADCDCTVRERMSGHKTECWFPAYSEALALLKQGRE